MDDNENNVFRLGSIDGGKAVDKEQIPENDYVIVDIDDQEFYASGFMIFTPHHVAIMQDQGDDKGAIPVLVLPLLRVKSAELAEDDSMELPL
jgi:hypothetical protein